MKKSTQKIIMFQAQVINMCNKEQQSNSNLEERIEKIEKYLRSGNISVSNNTPRQQNYVSNINTTKSTVNNSTSRPKTSSTVKETNTKKYSTEAAKFWPEIVNDLKTSGKIVLYTNLMNTNAVELNDMTIGINFPRGLTAFGKTVLEKQENKKELANLVSIACGKPMEIKYISEAEANKVVTNQDKLQSFAEAQDIPFEVIE